jgi:hypothetical protein
VLALRADWAAENRVADTMNDREREEALIGQTITGLVRDTDGTLVGLLTTGSAIMADGGEDGRGGYGFLVVQP